MVNRRDFIKMGVGAGLGGLALASERAGAGHETRRPNILWITMDDARADTLGCYG